MVARTLLPGFGGARGVAAGQRALSNGRAWAARCLVELGLLVVLMSLRCGFVISSMSLQYRLDVGLMTL